MQRSLEPSDIEQIANVLGVEARREADHWSLILDNPEQERHIRVEIYPDIPIGEDHGSLVSVYTHDTHLQLHFVSGYVVSTLLGEVTFVAEREEFVSGLTVEREAACSLYSNVQTSMLSGDFTRLGPEVMLSGIALMLTEEPDPDMDEEDTSTP
ncbi:MAG: hypothetical protein R6W82_07050 [bacterium]